MRVDLTKLLLMVVFRLIAAKISEICVRQLSLLELGRDRVTSCGLCEFRIPPVYERLTESVLQS